MAENQAATTTLKGIALVEAIEAGMIQKSANGYNIIPFLRFWEAFSKWLPNGER